MNKCTVSSFSLRKRLHGSKHISPLPDNELGHATARELYIDDLWKHSLPERIRRRGVKSNLE